MFRWFTVFVCGVAGLRCRLLLTLNVLCGRLCRLVGRCRIGLRWLLMSLCVTRRRCRLLGPWVCVWFRLVVIVLIRLRTVLLRIVCRVGWVGWRRQMGVMLRLMRR